MRARARILLLVGLAMLAVLLCGPVQAQAQTQIQTQTRVQTYQPRHEGIGIGVKGGPLFANIDQVNVSSGISSRTGLIGGLFLGGNRPGVVGVGVDLLYARKSVEDDSTGQKATFDYINVPVYLRINAGSQNLSGVSVYGIVGADLNFLLKGRNVDLDHDITDSFNRADYGIAFGLGVEVTRFLIEARFTKGLGNIAKDEHDPVTKVRTFAVMFGFRFN